MINVVTEDDGFLVFAGLLQELGYLHGNELGTFVKDDVLVHIPLVIDAVFNDIAVFVFLTCPGSPALQIKIEVHPDHFVGRKKTVFYALLEGIAVDWFTKVIDIGDLFGLFRCRRQAEMCGRRKIVQNLPPGEVSFGTAPVTLINYDKVKEIRGELFVDILLFFVSGNRLVQRQVNLKRLVDLALADLGHRRTERLEVVVFGLINENVAVGQKQDAFLLSRLPQSPDNLEGGVGFASTGGHDQQNTILPFGNGFYCTVNGVGLVINSGGNGQNRRRNRVTQSLLWQCRQSLSSRSSVATVRQGAGTWCKYPVR